MTRTISKIYNTNTADCIRYEYVPMEAALVTKSTANGETIESLEMVMAASFI
jgi:hypothetical protein